MKKPQTDTEWHAYRAEWGIYNLLQAVESLAKIHLPKETTKP